MGVDTRLDDLRSEPGVTNMEALITDYETADPSRMAVSGALRYWRKYHPEQIASGPPGQG